MSKNIDYGHRMSKVRSKMEENGLDAILIWGEPSGPGGMLSVSNDTGYLTDWPAHQGGLTPSLMVITRQKTDPTMIVGPHFCKGVAKTHTDIEDIIGTDPSKYADVAKEVLDDRGCDANTIGIMRLDEIPHWFLKTINTTFAEANIVDATNIISSLKLIKSSAEINRLRESAKMSDLMIETLTHSVKPGRRLYEAVAEMNHAPMMKGAQWSRVWMTAGPMGGPFPGFDTKRFNRKFEQGDMVNVGTYVINDNYWAHQLKSIVIGEPSKEQKDHFGVVLEAQEKALELCEPGTKLVEIYDTIHQVYDKHSKTISFKALHGIGLGYTELPRFPQPLGYGTDETAESAGTSTEKLDLSMQLEPGMVFELHPNIWEGPAGDQFTAIGDMVLVTKNGPELLTSFDRELLGY